MPADQRSDIFSFGCVLFEMVTARRAFHADSAAETMTAILREEPLDLIKDAAPVPAALEPVLRHCLEKRPEDRFHSARDLAFVLQAQPASAASPGRAEPVVAAAPRVVRPGALLPHRRGGARRCSGLRGRAIPRHAGVDLHRGAGDGVSPGHRHAGRRDAAVVESRRQERGLQQRRPRQRGPVPA